MAKHLGNKNIGQSYINCKIKHHYIPFTILLLSSILYFKTYSQSTYFFNEQNKSEEKLKTQKIKTKSSLTLKANEIDTIYFSIVKYDSFGNIIEERNLDRHFVRDENFNKYIYEYDRNGNILKKTTIEEGEFLGTYTPFISTHIETYLFDEFGRKTEYKEYDNFEYPTYQEKFVYYDGKLIEEIKFGGGFEDTTIYEYNNAKQISRKIRHSYGSTDTIIYKYSDSGYSIISPENTRWFNVNGILIKEVRKSMDGTIFDSSFWHYDKKDRIVEESFSIRNGKPETYYIYKYDSVGNMFQKKSNHGLEEIIYDSQGRKINSIYTGTNTYREEIYSYDEKDNLIEVIMFDDKGSSIPTAIHKFQYEFYR